MTQQDQQEQKASFMEALAESFTSEQLQVGQLVSGQIVAVSGDLALIAVGGKTEAIMDRAELGELRPGDNLEAVVVATAPELKVSHRLAIERREREALKGAFANRIPVQGKVTGRNRGGYDVSIAGIRAFCPYSQMELGYPKNLDAYLGKSFTFLITEMAEDLSTMVVSRAAVLLEEKEEAKRQAWEKIHVGSVLEGTVKTIRDFGVFVDLGGVDGMIHTTELSHRQPVKPSQVVRVGEKVQVKVLEADREKERIALSLKALQPDPWDEVLRRYQVGGPFTGKVVRKAEFGAFVELPEGVDGLLHVTQLPPGMRLDDPSLEVGQTVTGFVRELDADRRRIGLSLRPVATSDPWLDAAERYPEGTLVEATVERVAPFGVFVELEPGLEALIPASESDVPKGKSLSDSFVPGTRVAAVVLSVDAGHRRLSLSVKKAKEKKAAKEFRRWAEERKAKPEPQVTAFGLALLKALKEREVPRS
ncbi:MAG: S1 RNA-binding domain-containing protein [Thermoanaerobaculum sp.]|nr:S1 RNA-binding domain-containing protein [Thermoanaerobaculum sp.]MDW7967688.1 S1 RNA-binding domain-containing protein [Thermoanaerobaculum sp.]